MPALAITDTNNLFGALEFSEKAAKDGIQPIIGLQLTLDFGDGAAMGARHYESAAGWANVVLIAQNEIGYRNLMKLASASWLETAGEPPHLSLPRLAGHTEGVIAADRGADRAARPRLLRGSAATREDAPRCADAALRRTPICRAATPRACRASAASSHISSISPIAPACRLLRPTKSFFAARLRL